MIYPVEQVGSSVFVRVPSRRNRQQTYRVRMLPTESCPCPDASYRHNVCYHIVEARCTDLTTGRCQFCVPDTCDRCGKEENVHRFLAYYPGSGYALSRRCHVEKDCEHLEQATSDRPSLVTS